MYCIQCHMYLDNIVIQTGSSGAHSGSFVHRDSVSLCGIVTQCCSKVVHLACAVQSHEATYLVSAS